MMFDPYKPYLDIWPHRVRAQRRLGKPPVRHQQTCPVCGRGLVNIYKQDGTWKCRRCWEEEENHV